jgi:hypothetical protein
VNYLAKLNVIARLDLAAIAAIASDRELCHALLNEPKVIARMDLAACSNRISQAKDAQLYCEPVLGTKLSTSTPSARKQSVGAATVDGAGGGKSEGDNTDAELGFETRASREMFLGKMERARLIHEFLYKLLAAGGAADSVPAGARGAAASPAADDSAADAGGPADIPMADGAATAAGSAPDAHAANVQMGGDTVDEHPPPPPLLLPSAEATAAAVAALLGAQTTTTDPGPTAGVADAATDGETPGPPQAYSRFIPGRNIFAVADATFNCSTQLYLSVLGPKLISQIDSKINLDTTPIKDLPEESKKVVQRTSPIDRLQRVLVVLEQVKLLRYTDTAKHTCQLAASITLLDTRNPTDPPVRCAFSRAIYTRGCH